MRRGKVRDIYDLGDRLLLVSTDRISAFDWVLPTAIPDKGRVLTQIAAFWFELLGEPNHLITTDVEQMDLPPEADRAMLAGRSTLCRKDRSRADRVRGPRLSGRFRLEGIPAERHGLRHRVAGRPDRKQPGCRNRSSPPRPRPPQGHDENISFERMVEIVGPRLGRGIAAAAACGSSARGSEYARQRGIIIADTKFEFGQVGGELLLIDEVLTPDSSRFWPADQYAPAGASRRSTSSSCAIGSRRPTGTRTVRRRRCPTTSWPRPGKSTSKPMSD